MINDKYLKSKEFYDSLSASLKLLVLFLIGIGNYRSVLFLIVFFCIKAIVDYKDKHIFLQILFVPILLLSVFFDFKNGQLWLIHNFNNLPLFVVAFVVVDHVSTMFINAAVERISKGHIFSYCNNCRFENIKLTSKCGHCGYENSSAEPIAGVDTRSIYNEQYQTQLPLFRKFLNADSIANLSLEEGETICMSIKVSFGSGPYVDGYKKLCKQIVITNKNVIFLHNLYFQRGWRWREKISLKSISEITAVRKKISVGERQAIRLNANGHTYELFFWSINKSNDEFMEYFGMVKQQLAQS